MYGYLKELFYHEDESNRPRFGDVEEHRELEAAFSRAHDEIDESLGRTFYNDYWETLLKLADIERLACLRHGFRLAVRLMLG